jgi:hypothetical protein
MVDYSRQHTLAFHELSEWQVTTHSGEIITIYADSVREDEGYYVFDIAIAGSPLSLLPVAKIPLSLVLEYESTYVGLSDPPDEESELANRFPGHADQVAAPWRA